MYNLLCKQMSAINEKRNNINVAIRGEKLNIQWRNSNENNQLING